MKKYLVDLDGVSVIMSYGELSKGDLLTLDEDGETILYRVREVKENALELRWVKALEPLSSEESGEGVRYQFEGVDIFFENRLSKNQTIVVNNRPYKVLNVEKKTRSLELEKLETILAHSVYGVYLSRASEGLNIRDREKDGYVAEKYFKSRMKAFGYIMQERGKGRMVSR